MKKILLTLFVLISAFIGFNSVKAAEVKIDDLSVNTYIIGDRIYEFKNIKLTVFDAVQATREYLNNNPYAEDVPIYYIFGTSTNKVLYEVTGSADASGLMPLEKVEDIEEIYPNGVIDATAINNQPLKGDQVLESLEQRVIDAVYHINNTMNVFDYGFNSISYEDNTVTFDIANLNAKLADFNKYEIAELFMFHAQDIANISYKLGETTKNVTNADMDETSEVIALAKELLFYLSEGSNTLDYRSVAGKSITATVEYQEYGLTYTDEYTLEFTYNMENFLNTQDSNIMSAVANLGTEISETEGGFGFQGVNYENKKVTYHIINIDAKLADYKESKIVDLFLANITDAKTIQYSIGDWSKTVNLPEDADTESEVIALAKELLYYLSGGANTLNLGSVANKSVDALVTYKVGAYIEEVTYTLEFNYDLSYIMGEHQGAIMSAVNNELAVEPILYEVGFNGIEYNFDNKTVTYSIRNLSGKLADYKESKLVTLFLDNIKGASSIQYSIGNWNKTVNLPEDADTESEVIALAKELLYYLSGGANTLNLGSVANKSVTATVNYVYGSKSDSVDYTLAFTYDMALHVEDQDYAIENGIGTLDLTDSGFSMVNYDKVNRIVTFTIGDGSIKLANFKDSGIVDLFINNINYASKITYNLGYEKVVNLPEDADETTEVVALSKEILVYLAVESNTLDLNAVDGDSISAVVTYDVNGKTENVTYTIKFTK